MVIYEDFDARDIVALDVLVALVSKGVTGSYNVVSSNAYNIAEAFLKEREHRLELEEDRRYDD